MTFNFLTTLTYILRMPSFYYAVAKGRKPGVYHSWPECQAQIHQFSGSIFKKFSSKSEADNFIKSNNNFSNVSSSTPSSKKSTSFLKTNRSASTSPQEKKLLKRMIAIELKNTEAKTKKRKLESENETEPVKIAKQNACDTSSQNTSYIIDKDGYVNVYTDGACSSNGTRGARAGLGVWFGDNHPSNVSEAVLGRATNNMAEIQAVTRAAEQAKNAGITKLKINTDSQFLISCITQWMPKWKKNGWQTASKQPVINKTELLEMEKALKSLDVVWNHVNGHVGIYGNEMADKLAREGCQHYKQLSKR